ncbi:hypothetical protein [Pedobacter hartonius]|uniref:Uncharacterized protein n=1 Tax=Pedobacter hartonius TaxID=425514 RepID=A0A1H4GA34_9SPHI|nr:hypothetical protein [Pedobacter hartonius]SEB06459.1 hypothetical protein SAMN05443550_109164 [Pedobacter hartonius]
MKRAGILMIIIGVITIIAGLLTFTDLTTVNAVDSHNWTINLNGIKSFQWPVFTGGALIVVGIIFHIADYEKHDKIKIG